MLNALFLTTGPTVCIDPGHPSEVGRGTSGKSLTELHANWEMALLVRDLLRSRGIHTVLTKSSEEEYVSNRKRAEIANASHASLMLRLHCDDASGSGFTVFYPDRVGRSGSFEGPSEDVLADSEAMATAFHTQLDKDTRGLLRDEGLKSDTATKVGAKQGALTGSIFSKVPVLLVEMVVLNNPKDEALLIDPKRRKQLAVSLADAALTCLKKD